MTRAVSFVCGTDDQGFVLAAVDMLSCYVGTTNADGEGVCEAIASATDFCVTLNLDIDGAAVQEAFAGQTETDDCDALEVSEYSCAPSRTSFFVQGRANYKT